MATENIDKKLKLGGLFVLLTVPKLSVIELSSDWYNCVLKSWMQFTIATFT